MFSKKCPGVIAIPAPLAPTVANEPTETVADRGPRAEPPAARTRLLAVRQAINDAGGAPLCSRSCPAALATLRIDSLRLIIRPPVYAPRSLSPNEFVYTFRTPFTTSFTLSK